MKTTNRINRRSRWICYAAAAAAGTVFGIPFVNGCNDRLLSLTNFIDPCGTILANCAPGDFQVQNSFVGDYCLDPTCTVPGQCDEDGDGPPLGTQIELCP